MLKELPEENSNIEEDGLEKTLSESGLCITAIHGVSMEPMLDQKTDRVIIEKITGRLLPGDVALYRRGDSYVLHRVIEVLPGGYLIRGDNCIGTEKVSDPQVIGRLCAVQRNGSLIEVTDALNRKYMEKAKATLWIRKGKAGIFRLIKKVLFYV